MTRRASPSAALVLGVLAGAIASVTYLPTVFPLTLRVVDAEGAIALSHVTTASLTTARWLEAGVALTPHSVTELRLHSLRVWTHENAELYKLGVPLPDAVVEQACASSEAELWTLEGEAWAVSCLRTPRHQIIAAVRPSFMSGTEIAYFILVLALIVGIITAIGVLRVLRPLSRVTQALKRVGEGERGVRMGTNTGMAELDELVERLNAAAQAMEDREDAITARIEVVHEMARLVAHEIRNPLQSLELLTTLVAEEEDPSERKELATSIHQEIRILDQVVSRLLSESAGRGGLRLRRSVQPVAPLVQQVVSLCRPEASSRGIRLSPGLMSWTPASVDGPLLARSIENLVVNALQAVSPGAGEVRISLYDEAPWLCFAVDDNGPGVEPQLEPHIFEPNVTNRSGGTGLGLTLVKGVIEAHGGYIDYTTSALGGARFVARIPCQTHNGDEEVGERNAAPDPGGGRQPVGGGRAREGVA